MKKSVTGGASVMLFIILQAIALGISFYICLGFGNHCMKNSGLRITIGNSSAVGHYYWIRLDADKNCTLAPSDLACLHEFFLDIGATFLTGIGILVGVVVLLHSLPLLIANVAYVISLACCSIGAMSHRHLADSQNKTKVS